MTIKRLNIDGIKPQTKNFRGEQYFDQMLKAGWIFEFEKLNIHPTLEIINKIRRNCEALIENQNAQSPIIGAKSKRVSLSEIVEQLTDPFWWLGFFLLNTLFFQFVSFLVGFLLTFLVLGSVAFYRAFRHAYNSDKIKDDLSHLKNRESEIRKAIEEAVEKISTRPFIITHPHLKILFQPLSLPTQSERRWDEHMLKLAHQNTESLFIDLSDKISPFEG